MVLRIHFIYKKTDFVQEKMAWMKLKKSQTTFFLDSQKKNIFPYFLSYANTFFIQTCSTHNQMLIVWLIFLPFYVNVMFPMKGRRQAFAENLLE